MSLLTYHFVFSPKYRGKVLLGEVAEAAKGIIRENCKELDIEVIDKPFFRKESFTKETILSVKRWKGVYGKRLRSPPKYSVSWIAKRINGRNSKLLRDRFPYLKEWCLDHLWALSCYHKTFQKSFIKNASQSVGHGWEVVEKYISGQKGYYENIDTVPVVVIDEEKEKALKIGHITLYTKFFTVTGPVP